MAASLHDRDPDRSDDESELDDRFDRAVSLISHFEYAKAEAILRPLVVRYRRAGGTDKVARSMFWLGYCLEKQAEIEPAAVLYREVIRSHDGTAAATQAARRLEQIRQAGQG
jgi:TolA-binding protein